MLCHTELISIHRTVSPLLQTVMQLQCWLRYLGFEYVKYCKIFLMLANCILLKRLGELVLHLTKATYEQLGLEGSPTSKLKKKYGKSPLISTVQAICYVAWNSKQLRCLLILLYVQLW